MEPSGVKTNCKQHRNTIAGRAQRDQHKQNFICAPNPKIRHTAFAHELTFNNELHWNLLVLFLKMLKTGRICLKYGTRASPIPSADITRCWRTFKVLHITRWFLVFMASEGQHKWQTSGIKNQIKEDYYLKRSMLMNRKKWRFGKYGVVWA